jgi:hypothetical protein
VPRPRTRMHVMVLALACCLVAGWTAPGAAAAKPRISVDDIRVVEGHSGVRSARFTLTRAWTVSGPSSVLVTT